MTECKEDEHDWVAYQLNAVKKLHGFGYDDRIKISKLLTQTVVCVDCGKVKQIEPENNTLW